MRCFHNKEHLEHDNIWKNPYFDNKLVQWLYMYKRRKSRANDNGIPQNGVVIGTCTIKHEGGTRVMPSEEQNVKLVSQWAWDK